MITVTNLTKKYGDRLAVDDLTLPRGRRPRHRIRRPQRGRQVHHHADDGRAHPARPRRRPVRRDPLPGPTEPRPDRRRGAGGQEHASGPHRPEPPARHRRPQRDPDRPDRPRPRRGGAPAGRRQAGRRPSRSGCASAWPWPSALLGDPQVLLLDEPSNGLDPDGIRWLRDYLGDFAARGGTVFVSSHLISELSMFAHDLVVVGAGRLLAAESVGSITARNDVAVRVETPQPTELLEHLAAHGVAAESAGRSADPPGHHPGGRLADRLRPPDPPARAHRGLPLARGQPARHDAGHRRVRLRLIAPPDPHPCIPRTRP